jgi:hypothetical protein
MDQDRPLAAGGNLQLADQPAHLHRARRALVEVVQPDLPAGDHLWLGEQPVQLAQNLVVNLRRVVRINARAGVEFRDAVPPIELAANPQSPIHPVRVLANPNRQHRAHARVIRTA